MPEKQRLCQGWPFPKLARSNQVTEPYRPSAVGRNPASGIIQIQQFILATDCADEHGYRGLLMKRHLAAIHPQGEGTVIYNALVICVHPWNLWLQLRFLR